MKICFVLMCLMGGVPEKLGKMYLSNMNNCLYFKKFLDGQVLHYKKQDGRMESRKYECICKLTKVPEATRLY